MEENKTRELKEPGVTKCKKCGRILDLLVLRERKDYIPGRCPMCGGYLKPLPWKFEE